MKKTYTQEDIEKVFDGLEEEISKYWCSDEANSTWFHVRKILEERLGFTWQSRR